MKPNTVLVGSTDYTIQWVPDLIDEDDGTEMFGVSLTMQQTIQVNDGITKRAKRSTLFHEITHMVFEGSGIELEYEKEESIVRALETILFDTLTRQENRAVTKYLFGDAIA